MSSLSIPFALGPHGNEVPIEEAERFKINYYRCPECSEIVNPRKGEQRSYFAHKQGVLDETTCSLSSQADVDEMVDELRTSDVEQGEQNREIRVYLGEEPGGRLQLFGVLPSLDWAVVPAGVDADSQLVDMDISASGVERAPVPQSFHPSEPEVAFELDPEADSYEIQIEGPDALDSITGTWTADELSEGDVFVGDQTRARRFDEGRLIKLGEWVYSLTEGSDTDLPDFVETKSLATWTALAFPARADTESFLQQQGIEIRTDEYGFDADVVLPPRAHPTSDAPIHSDPGNPILVGVTPSPELDPTFEVVSIPRGSDDTVELESTGPGNPRYFKSRVPPQGSKRISVHQRNSSRHRLIHLHAEEGGDEPQGSLEAPMNSLSLKISEGDDTVHVAPIDDDAAYAFPPDFAPMTLPGIVTYAGPEGLDAEITATFPQSHDGSSVVTRVTDDLETQLPNLGHWVQQGCIEIKIEFDGIGSVTLDFSALSGEAT